MDKVVHFEVPFDDKQRAMKFYQDIFGWKVTDMPQMNYVSASTVDVDEQFQPKEPGAINGGLSPRDKAAPHPQFYIGVDSLDATIDRVVKAGGKLVTPKTPIPDMGAFARIADTEGNVIGLYQGK